MSDMNKKNMGMGKDSSNIGKEKAGFDKQHNGLNRDSSKQSPAPRSPSHSDMDSSRKSDQRRPGQTDNLRSNDEKGNKGKY